MDSTQTTAPFIRGTSHAKVERIDETGTHTNFVDSIAQEEPLEIRLDFELSKIRRQQSVSITMRTPGNDSELAVGFLFTEGLIRNRKDVESFAHCGPSLPHLGHSNVMKLVLARDAQPNIKNLERNFYTTSSCGVCGKSSIDALKTQNQFTENSLEDHLRVKIEIINSLSDKLRKAQKLFESTGGLHASAFFSPQGDLIDVREDVGRHNALDKLIGRAFLDEKLPLNHTILFLSGRISFELVQKASMAGVRMIAAVGAPSSLALELAKEMNMTLVGFVRGGKFNVYTGAERLI